MMTSNEVEAAGLVMVNPLLKTWGEVYDTNKMPQNIKRQKTLGDRIIAHPSGVLITVEIKTEQRETGNLFLETWSNRTSDERYKKRGWFDTLETDLIVFVFLDTCKAYRLDFPKLRLWWESEANWNKYRWAQAGASWRGEQKNNTWGHPVPIADLRGVSSLNFQEYNLKDYDPITGNGPYLF